MFLRAMAFIFAIVFIVLGLLGFVPPFTSQHVLFNYFTVGIVLSLFYILIGLFALSVSGSMRYSRLYFKCLGILFAVIAIGGFSMNGNLGILQVAISDSFFYLLTAIIALYLGFTSKLPRSYTH